MFVTTGVLAQLVERLNGIEEVSGSSPLCSMGSEGRSIFTVGLPFIFTFEKERFASIFSYLTPVMLILLLKMKAETCTRSTSADRTSLFLCEISNEEILF